MSIGAGRARLLLEISSGSRCMVAPVAVAAAAAGVVTTIALIDPNIEGHYPTCPWLALTGTFCPGCGSLRAIHALAHAELGVAMARNPLTVIAVGWLVLWFGLWTWRRLTGRVRTTMAPAWLLHGILVVILGYWVLRNIPGWTFLSPA